MASKTNCPSVLCDAPLLELSEDVEIGEGGDHFIHPSIQAKGWSVLYLNSGFEYARYPTLKQKSRAQHRELILAPETPFFSCLYAHSLR